MLNFKMRHYQALARFDVEKNSRAVTENSQFSSFTRTHLSINLEMNKATIVMVMQFND
jgi:hypothetical protein